MSTLEEQRATARRAQALALSRPNDPQSAKLLKDATEMLTQLGKEADAAELSRYEADQRARSQAARAGMWTTADAQREREAYFARRRAREARTDAAGITPEKRRELLEATGIGRSILREEAKQAPKPPLDPVTRELLSGTWEGRQALAARDAEARERRA